MNLSSIAIVVLLVLAAVIAWIVYGIHGYRKAVAENDRTDTGSEAGLWSLIFLACVVRLPFFG